ncbi:MAG: alpha/beta hydrolase [Holophagaceae bacterium]|nr:alpha/beta hydrolase [Holophagaceae bacterium]
MDTRRSRFSGWLASSILVSAMLAGCGGGPDGGAASALPPPANPCPSLQSGVDLLPGTTAAPACAEASAPVTSSYAPGPDHLLDLYRPASGSGPFATVIWIHGGGWREGSRTQAEQAKRLVCRGYAVASIDYRLSGTAKFPAQIQDVKAAIRYLRANATAYNLDGTRFATFGSSAGGHLASLAATSAGIAALEDLSQGNASTSSAVQAAIAWFGPVDLGKMDSQLLAQGCPPGAATHGLATSPESQFLGCTVNDPACAATIAMANPITYLGPNSPPMYILHGTEDCTVPMAQSDLLKAALESAGRCVTKRNVAGAGHGGAQWQTAPPQDAVATFLDAVFKR